MHRNASQLSSDTCATPFAHLARDVIEVSGRAADHGPERDERRRTFSGLYRATSLRAHDARESRTRPGQRTIVMALLEVDRRDATSVSTRALDETLDDEAIEPTRSRRQSAGPCADSSPDQRAFDDSSSHVSFHFLTARAPAESPSPAQRDVLDDLEVEPAKGHAISSWMFVRSRSLRWTGRCGSGLRAVTELPERPRLTYCRGLVQHLRHRLGQSPRSEVLAAAGVWQSPLLFDECAY